MLDQGRKYDLELLQKAWKLAKSDAERQLIDEVAWKIIKQDQFTSSARESLIKEVRSGRRENVKDINYELKKHESKYHI